jgi:hypothetical protein
MNFLELMRTLETRLGYQHLPLNPSAGGIKDIFDSSAVHHELMIKLVRAIFAANRCQRLTDTVTHAATFNALGPLRLETLRSGTTDVCTYQFLEELCRALDGAFADAAMPSRATRPRPTPPTASVVSLDAARRSRWLRSSR